MVEAECDISIVTEDVLFEPDIIIGVSIVNEKYDKTREAPGS